jgi:hypothetical protein
MDKDGSGSISKTEVMVALQRVNVFLTTEETCLLMDTLAGDQSGKISEKSIIDFWNASQVASELEEHQKLQSATQAHKTDVTDSKEAIPDVRVVVYTTDQKDFIPPNGHIARLDDRYTGVDLPEDSSFWTVDSEESAAGLKHWASGTVSIKDLLAACNSPSCEMGQVLHNTDNPEAVKAKGSSKWSFKYALRSECHTGC